MLGKGAVVVGRYQLLERIGEGGMGEVWCCEHVGLGRRLAIKFIRTDAGMGVEEAVQRFVREARNAAAVHHRNVIDVVDFGVTEGGSVYLAMDYLEGGGLDQRLKQAPPPELREVVAWISGALGGLAAIHDAGIVHRDLKPSNIFLARDADGVVPIVLDFGISRQESGVPDAPSGSFITRTGQSLGTPHYMSPEQIRASSEVDRRTDIYSMGAILYEVLAGQPPFDGPSVPAIIAKIVTQDPPALRTVRPDVPEVVAAVVHRALARDQDARFPDARAMRQALLAAVGGAEAVGVVVSVPRIDAIAPTVAVSYPTSPVADTASVPELGLAPPTDPSTPTATPTPRSGASMLVPALLAAGLVVAAGGLCAAAYFVFLREHATDDQRTDLAGAPVRPVSATSDAGTTATSQPVVPAGAAYQIAGPAPLPKLASLWMHARDRAGAADLRFVEGDGGWTMDAPPSMPAEQAIALAQAMHGEISALAAQDSRGLRPVLLRTNDRLNIRAGPSADSELVRSLPDRTIVVGLYGTVDGHESRAGGRGDWTRVAASFHDDGWSASRYLDSYGGCVPASDALSGDVPPSSAETVRADTTSSTADVRTDGRRQRAFLLVARDPDNTSSWVGVYGTDGSCSLTKIGVQLYDGFVEEAVFAQSQEDGGETLLLVSSHRDRDPPRDGMETWSIRRVDDPATLWRDVLPTAAQLTRARRAGVGGSRFAAPDFPELWSPIVVREPDGSRVYYRWTGSGLEQAF